MSLGRGPLFLRSLTDRERGLALAWREEVLRGRKRTLARALAGDLDSQRAYLVRDIASLFGVKITIDDPHAELERPDAPSPGLQTIPEEHAGNPVYEALRGHVFIDGETFTD